MTSASNAYRDRTDRVADLRGRCLRLLPPSPVWPKRRARVEIMLAEAYSARDHVALVTFRGDTAGTGVPAHALACLQAKRRLAGLPGGGATPLAGAMQVAFEAALQARCAWAWRRHWPSLTDGNAAISRCDGTANRAQAAEDATTLARAIACARHSGAGYRLPSLRPKPTNCRTWLRPCNGHGRIALPPCRCTRHGDDAGRGFVVELGHGQPARRVGRCASVRA